MAVHESFVEWKKKEQIVRVYSRPKKRKCMTSPLVSYERSGTQEKNSKCGVCVRAMTSSYSSVRDQNQILCDWVSKVKRLKLDEDGFAFANFTTVRRHNEPYI